MNKYIIALAIGAVAVPAAAQAQVTSAITQTIAGTRLDVTATGEVARIPDVAIITAGVVTRSATASGAIQENARRMERIVAALKSAGVADRDIQTSSINLNPEYRYQENQPPQLTGYTASNQLTIRFREIRSSGRILDALVAEGANQINGPTLTVENRQTALNEARMNAIAGGRARAELYARGLGMRVVRIVSVSETGGHYAPPPPMPERGGMDAMAVSKTEIVPGEQQLQTTVSMVFELQ